MDSVERRILGFASFSHFFTHFTMLLFPALVTTIARDTGLGLDRVLSMSFLMYLLYGLGALPWGFLSDRGEPRLVLGAGIFLAGAGLLVAGLVDNPVVLPWALAVTGLGNAAYHPAGLALVSKGIKERGKGMGINGIFGNLGIAGAPFAAGLLAWWVGWRVALTVLGAIGIAAGIITWLIPLPVARDSDKQEGQSVTGRHALLLFAVLCLAVISSGLMYRSFTLILPSWLEGRLSNDFRTIAEALGGIGPGRSLTAFDSLMAALVTGGTFLLGILGQLIGGRVADRVDLRKAYFAFFAAALPFIILARYASGWVVVIGTLGFAFFTLGMQPIENSLYAMLVPPRWRSMGYGVKFTLGFGIGSLAVFIIGSVEPLRGLDGVIGLTSVYLAVTVAWAGFLWIMSRGRPIRHT